MREGLSRIDESWAAARFDSLPHVVHILTSRDREGEVQFLKEQSDLIEDVVDEVVHAYHHGFNKAIQNYSQVSLSCAFNSLLCFVLFSLVDDAFVFFTLISFFFNLFLNMIRLMRSLLALSKQCH